MWQDVISKEAWFLKAPSEYGNYVPAQVCHMTVVERGWNLGMNLSWELLENENYPEIPKNWINGNQHSLINTK